MHGNSSNTVATASAQPHTGVTVEMARHRGMMQVEHTEVRDVMVGQGGFCALGTVSWCCDRKVRTH